MSSLADYLDKGASLGRDAPCLVEGERTLSYGEVQDLSWRVEVSDSPRSGGEAFLMIRISVARRNTAA